MLSGSRPDVVSLASPETGRSREGGSLLLRLLGLSWAYRGRVLRVLGYQIVLLSLGLAGLGLTGLAIDILRHRLDPSNRLPDLPAGLGRLVDAEREPMRAVLSIGAAILAMAAARAVINYGYALSVGYLVHMEIVPDLRARVYDKLQRLSFRFFDANKSGSLINRVTGDVQLVRSFVDGVLLPSVIMVLSLGVYVAYMLRAHVLLTLACLAPTPLLWIASTLFARWAQPAYLRNRELVDRMVLSFTEGLQGIQVIKGLGREREVHRRFDERSREVREQQQETFRTVSVLSPTIDLLGQVSLVILLGMGGLLVTRDRMTLGQLVVFAGILQQFSGQIASMATIVNTAQQSFIGAKRVFEVLDTPVEITSPEAPARPARVEGRLVFERVTFGYDPERPVLHDVHLDVAPGQFVAVIGPTGAGKSTLLSLIPRFYDPTSGRVLLDGIDLRRHDLDQIRRRMGVVFQDNFLFSNTVAANIAFGAPHATREQIERAAVIACAHEFIRELPEGYDTELGEAAANLSGGQRQRLAIARAVLLDPPLLLLDDPTAAVDASTEREILDAILSATRGRTTIMATHRAHLLRRAHQVIVLDRGRIAERGTHEELLRRRGHYASALALHDAHAVGARADDDTPSRRAAAGARAAEDPA
ncbi:ABC transporter family carbohydrate exporter [Sorangium cellulosum So ce56]|uniref:ABC transporter family carbohydrate exporter n=1 Tax=Sorangium cellulosum (strain So ce56) TaxID=448385 RepID=A9GLW5_SORC5|nr:ABC transporter ATP-binding protein [Sorangium cellulosum]CAN90336.1 ABC transporter family carbohydrate exporter [Sorangium cellulosum So ce56]